MTRPSTEARITIRAEFKRQCAANEYILQHARGGALLAFFDLAPEKQAEYIRRARSYCKEI